ncbi:alkaline phosphatase family protein [Clostridium vincentii]|uniref:Type I phosphodiesterase / nucleotide pyrophosphatase n=1 Tax=Clostridium vincentii TaxID=52704 RepID=A0A2T0BB92_9CLOT|nr:ectonucleotide pyrophosphatase/phosphodiesterase [Clostridium vincentii]PRR81103.1 Type I phosphodiesterase / nucleotide pyrophosphatase [Clostridium vincentii]
MKSKYMIIISFDAVSSDDLKILKTLPNFKKIIEGGSLIENVESVYPTLTYPAHATIVTGKYPKNHGIIDNTIFKAGDFNPNWYWYRKDIKGSTLYDLAKEKGLSTCSLLWPVTGGSSIKYNLAEIFKVKPHQNQIVQSICAGSLFYQLELNNKFGHIRRGLTQPALDDFVIEAAKYTINKYSPNLMFIHFTDVDTNRHHYGYSDKKAIDGLYRHDKRLGEIIKVLEEKNILHETDIVALGDHSQIDVDKMIKLNTLFKENNLITVNGKGKVSDFQALCKSLDGSAYVYLKNPKDEKLKKKVEDLLNGVKTNKPDPIEFILKDNEIIAKGADSNASFMIEASKSFYFVDDIEGDLLEDVKADEVGIIDHRHKATHGYDNKKDNYGTFFIGYGKDFKKGIVLDTGKLINHGPTLAKVLGVDLKNVDGEVVDAILQL